MGWESGLGRFRCLKDLYLHVASSFRALVRPLALLELLGCSLLPWGKSPMVTKPSHLTVRSIYLGYTHMHRSLYLLVEPFNFASAARYRTNCLSANWEQTSMVGQVIKCCTRSIDRRQTRSLSFRVLMCTSKGVSPANWS